MRDETLAQQRLDHLLTIDMGNACGWPNDQPGGGRATSLWRNVTCLDCKSTDLYARHAEGTG